MLSVVLFVSLVYQGLSLVSYGTDFITTFPENIAYYYTKDSWTTLKITAFHNDTMVKVTVNQTDVYDTTLNSGQIQNVHFPMYFEQYNLTRFLYCVRIVGTRPIVVLWVTQRGDSMQTNVVQPVENLGKYYLIPILNYTRMVGLYNNPNQFSRTFNTFRLIIINAENVNNDIFVTSSQRAYSVSLSPYEVHQIYTYSRHVTITAFHLVAVLLTHPCVETPGCECNMVVSQVLPSFLWGDTFVIPSLKETNATWLHVPSTTNVIFQGENVNDYSQLISFPYLAEESQFINTTSKTPIRIVSPGSIIEIIPETMFAACYLVQFNTTAGEILVIAEESHKDDVHVDNDLLTSTEWKINCTSKYSSVSMSLTGTHVIWHPTSKIGVYMFEKMTRGFLYGGSAIPISDVPDQNGCLEKPAKFVAGTDLMTWPESHQYCLNESYQLVTPNSPSVQAKMISWLQKEGRHDDIWIGLRRSWLTLDWYWQVKHESVDNVSYTGWANGQPDEPWKAMCASGHLDAEGNFFWESVACCVQMTPVCYKTGDYFSDFTFETLDDFPIGF